MSAILTGSEQARRSLGRVEPAQSLSLANVAWDQYLAIGQALADRPGLRITYDRGNLEIMVTSPEHEVYKKWLVRLVEILLEMFGLPFATAGNMTFQREDLIQGFE